MQLAVDTAEAPPNQMWSRLCTSLRLLMSGRRPQLSRASLLTPSALSLVEEPRARMASAVRFCSRRLWPQPMHWHLPSTRSRRLRRYPVAHWCPP
eukprot:8709862-Prorocentrum_lima.AAC.1